MKKIVSYAAVHSLLTAGYIASVAGLMTLIGDNKRLAQVPEFVAAITMLTLLVISAATVGSLIFGRPIMWYLDGKKREAVKLLVSTISLLVAMLLVIVIVIFTMTN